MSKRSDILKVFAGENPEYVPWFGDLSYWIDYLTDEKKIPEKYLFSQKKRERGLNEAWSGTFTEEGLQELHRDLGVGFYLQGYFPFKTVYDEHVKATYSNDGKYRITTFETPYGNLREVWEYLPANHSFAIREYLIKSAEDIAAFRFVYEHTEYLPDYELAIQRKDSIGDNGVVLVYTPKTPMMELVALKAGLETVVVELLGEEPEEFEELLEVMYRKHSEAVKVVTECPADCIMVPDNLSSEMVGGSIYDTYIKPIHEDWTEQIRNAGKKSYVHLDGTLNPLLRKLSYAGFDIIEAVTPCPVGDIELDDLRDFVKPETIIWGGIPGGFFTEQLSDAQFDDWVKRVLNLMRNNNRFVMGVADQVVPGSSFERIKRVSELVELYGKYDEADVK